MLLQDDNGVAVPPNWSLLAEEAPAERQMLMLSSSSRVSDDNLASSEPQS